MRDSLVVGAAAVLCGACVGWRLCTLHRAAHTLVPPTHAACVCCATLDGGDASSVAPEAATVDPYDVRPRSAYLSWDDYFMAIAFLSAQRSKDPKKQVGACIVNADHVIVGIGYNGFPRGCSDDALPWAKLSATGDVLGTKTPYVVHAEANAILNASAASLRGARLYVTMYPCCECAKLLIQAGVREVTFAEGKPGGGALYLAANRMLSLAGVKVSQLPCGGAAAAAAARRALASR